MFMDNKHQRRGWEEALLLGGNFVGKNDLLN